MYFTIVFEDYSSTLIFFYKMEWLWSTLWFCSFGLKKTQVDGICSFSDALVCKWYHCGANTGFTISFQGVTEILLNFLKPDQQVKLQVECIHTFYFCLGPFPFAKISPNFLDKNSFHLLVSFLVIPRKSLMQSMGQIWNDFFPQINSCHWQKQLFCPLNNM